MIIIIKLHSPDSARVQFSDQHFCPNIKGLGLGSEIGIEKLSSIAVIFYSPNTNRLQLVFKNNG